MASEVRNLLSESELADIMNGEFENPSWPFTEWHRSTLENATSVGIQCLAYMWFKVQPNLEPGVYCNATYDNFWCWPPTRAGETITQPCSKILESQYDPSVAQRVKGDAVRVCLENGTWLWGSWTNYTVCADNLDHIEKLRESEDVKLVSDVRYILFIGSILSFVCLVAALFIFYYFKCLRCDRVTVHIHLMVALTLRCILLVVITEPFIFEREHHYRSVNGICKAVLSLNLYATVTSILWMFLQGVYLHGKLTTVFDKGTPFKIYYSVGWGLPFFLVLTWATVMEIHYPVDCWENYSDLPYIWILLSPMIAALVANLIFLINIMRILLTKIQRSNTAGDAAQFRRAVKATVVLFPLLGINNLLFIYNPGGDYKRMFVILNTIFQSTQGIFVSILYCFLSSDVRDAIRRKYRRFAARRSANALRRNQRTGSRNSKYFNGTYHLNSGSYDGVVVGDRQAIFAPPTHFRSKFRSESSRSVPSKSPSPETINNILPGSETPSPPPIGGPLPHNHCSHNHPHHHHHRNHRCSSSASSSHSNILRPTPVVLTTCKHFYTDSRSAYELSVNIPLRDFNLLRN